MSVAYQCNRCRTLYREKYALPRVPFTDNLVVCFVPQFLPSFVGGPMEGWDLCPLCYRDLLAEALNICSNDPAPK